MELVHRAVEGLPPLPVGDDVALLAGGDEGREPASPETTPLMTWVGSTLPGQRITQGTRKRPSVPMPFQPLNGVVPPSSHVKPSVPLSLVKTMSGFKWSWARPDEIAVRAAISNAAETDFVLLISTHAALGHDEVGQSPALHAQPHAPQWAARLESIGF
jgi:hypothetical protein